MATSAAMTSTICIAKLDDMTIDPLIFTLPHPRTALKVCFVIPNSTNLLEVQKLDNSKEKSWFIGNIVRSDGSMHFMTPIDPLFVLLPVLEKCRNKTTESAGRFLSLDDILHNDSYPNLQYFHRIKTLESLLKCVCDYKEISSTFMFRLNDEKVLNWLKAKIEKLTSKFHHFNSLVLLNPATSIASCSPANDSEVSSIQNLKTKLVMDLVKDYLNEKWAALIEVYYKIELPKQSFNEALQEEYATLGIQDSVQSGTGKSDKRKKSAKEEDKNSGKKPRTSANKKALEKASKGMNSITSFFKKK